jgi:hypothetical protein
MKLLAIILLALLFPGGILRLVLFFRHSSLWPGPAPDQKLGRHSLFAPGLINILFSLVGLLMLYEEFSNPLDVLFGLAVVGVACEVTFRKNSISWPI